MILSPTVPVRISLVLFTLLVIFPAIYSGVGVAKAGSVIATIPAGPRPFNIAYDRSGGTTVRLTGKLTDSASGGIVIVFEKQTHRELHSYFLSA